MILKKIKNVLQVTSLSCCMLLADDVLDLDIMPQELYEARKDANNTMNDSVDNLDSYESNEVDEDDDEELVIDAIEVKGNRSVPEAAILHAIPFRVGQLFTSIKTAGLIRNLYDLKYFKDVKLWGKRTGKGTIKLIIVVEEDPIIGEISYEGMKKLSAAEIEKKLSLKTVLRTANLARLEEVARQIKKMLSEKDLHQAEVTPSIQFSESGAAEVVFSVKEGSVSRVRRVFFEGNNSITSRRLRKLLFTREDWVLGFMDKAGMYQPEAIEMDRHTIENFYQSMGFLTARVVDARVEPVSDCNDYAVTFVIEEGDQFIVSDVSVPGNDLISQEQLLFRAGIYPGQLYSRDAIRAALESLRILWGEYGYVNADIVPSIEPNFENRTVSIKIESYPNEKVFLNTITMLGNFKTREHVIRRQLTVREGDILSGRDMDRSKLKVEGLGYFDPREGVNWRIKPLDDGFADLELWLKEIKTGKFYVSLNFGGSLQDITSPAKSLKLEVTAADTNILGTGMSGYISGNMASDAQTITLNLTEPWLFGRQILGAFDAYYKHVMYDFKSVINDVSERRGGGSFMLGATSYKMYDTRFISQFGLESLAYNEITLRDNAIEDPEQRALILTQFNRRFQPGQLLWLSLTALQDFRSNPVHPNKGYQWSIANKFGIPALESCFGFYKFEADATYYTPLIGEFDLVFMLHGHLGLLTQINNKGVPYRELYHIGGPATVRGFKFGEIGPKFLGDSLGGKKTFFVNAELIFPLTYDLNMKGAVFYDGGSGWDTLSGELVNPAFVTDNRFNYRHAIGVGLRMINPQPIRVDWGFKLDKRKGENSSEVSFSMLREF